MIDQKPWVAVRDVCDQYGLTYESAKNKIRAGLFPVPTYMAGRIPVIDRQVHDEYFRRHREEGLRVLHSTSS